MTPSSYKYAAFISYSHRDKAWGERLHRALERYAVPKRIQGMEGRDGPIPARIFPVFRDREELPSSADLTHQITQALEASATLIVICSPRAAASRWVNEEILAFKRLGRADRILAVIIDGEPNVTDKPGELAGAECFPEALRFRLGADGALSPDRIEPVAADARPEGDGEENARLKVIAGVLGIGFDQLKQRDLEAQRNRLRKLVAISAAVAVGFAGLLALSVYFAREARQERNRALRHLGDSYAGAARDLVLGGRHDVATRVALMALRMSEGTSVLARDVLRYAGGNIALRARFPLSTEPRSRAGLSPDEQRLVVPIGNEAVLWNPVTGAAVLKLQGHTGVVRVAEFSSDGTRVLTASEDGTARLWDARDGRALASLGGDAEQMWFARFWRGGDVIVTATRTGLIQVWDTAQRRQIAALSLPSIAGTLIEGGGDFNLDVLGGVETLGLSNDGRKILAVTRMGAPVLYSFDAEEHSKVTLIAARSTTAAAISPDSRFAATASMHNGVSLVDAESGQIVRTLQPPSIGTAVLFSPDSRTLAATEGFGINLWDVASGAKRRAIEADGNISAMAFSPDGKLFAAGDLDGGVTVWNAGDGQPVARLGGHVGAVGSVQFAARTSTLYSSSSDGSVRMWSLDGQGPRRLASVPIENGFLGAVAHAGGRTIVADEGALTTVAPGSFTVRKERGAPAQFANLSASHTGDRFAATMQDGLVVYDVATGSMTRMSITDISDFTRGVWAPDDSSLAVAGVERGVIILDPLTGRVVRQIKPSADVHQVAYSRDGSKLFIFDRDGKLSAWNPDGRHLFDLASGPQQVFAVSRATDDVITGSQNSELAIWDANTGARKVALIGHGRGPIGGDTLSVGFSDDGRYVFSRSMDNTARVWEARAGRQLYSFNVQGDDERGCIAFVPGSKDVIVAGMTEHGQVINLETGALTLALPGLRGCAVFSADRMTAAGKTYGNVVIWDTARLTMTDEELVAAACQSALPSTARTFTQAEGDREHTIQNLRLDASRREVDVCTGAAAAEPVGVAATPAQGQMEKFAESPEPDGSMRNEWVKRMDEAAALAEHGKRDEFLASTEKCVALAREVQRWYGSSANSRRMLVFALTAYGGGLLDLKRIEAGRQALTEALDMFTVLERLAEMDEALRTLRAETLAALAAV